MNMPTNTPLSTSSAVNRASIASTHRLISGHIRKTPVISVSPADFGLAGLPLTFKLEFLQHTGSFKGRGAFANLCLRSVPPAGVTAASGGNHGAAVAYAARAMGHQARIFVPAISSPAKQALIRSYGADLVVGGERYDEALAGCEAHAAATGALKVHAFEQVETMLGQGSVGLELEEQAPGIDTLLVATGGGGLIGGIAAWYENRIKVVSVEPELAPTLHDALRAGAPVDAPTGGIAADSLAPRRVGQLMFPIARQHVAAAVLVPDDAIALAQRKLWDVMRVVAEPGGATALAALLCGAYRPTGDERVAVLLCGANTTAVAF
ncbi:MAG: threonine/serine dehydratase [Phyllobacteriaceae bacterium]|nr:threonine/serine dehydratase [Phyllobacteriaceae bacterium]